VVHEGKFTVLVKVFPIRLKDGMQDKAEAVVQEFAPKGQQALQHAPDLDVELGPDETCPPSSAPSRVARSTPGSAGCTRLMRRTAIWRTADAA
jgi:hypothetical protein